MMTRINYNNDLQALYDAVKQMGLTIETSIDQTWKALQKLDMKTAQAIIDGDEAIDQMERNIEKACLELVLTQTPVAGDWRRIASIMRMISDLERIADHCSDISEYIVQLAAKPAVELPAPMEKMFCLMKTMVKETVTAFVELSEDKQKALAAKNVAEQDITLGVRPNHIQLGGGANAMTATMDVSEMMGGEVHLHANANGRDVVIIVPTTELTGDHRDDFARGAKISFTFSGSTCHVFGADDRNLEL